MRDLSTVCVFAGSSPGRRPEYADAARHLGRHLAGAGVALVYGGARGGLMGAVADAALAAGGAVTGVIPRHLVDHEVAHLGLTELKLVGSMHERKALMAELADGFVSLPGGFGTLEETFETLTWTQLGLHTKPTGLLDVAGYFDPLNAFLDRAVEEGFLRPGHRAQVLTDDDPKRLLSRMAALELAPVAKWIDRTDR